MQDLISALYFVPRDVNRSQNICLNNAEILSWWLQLQISTPGMTEHCVKYLHDKQLLQQERNNTLKVES